MTRALVACLCLFPCAAAAQTIQLSEPACAHLPFDAGDVRRLLALELSVEGIAIDDAAALALAYDAAPCARGATTYSLVVRRPGVERRDTVSLADVPLATVARALALALAEAARDALREPDLAPEPDEPTAPEVELDAPRVTAALGTLEPGAALAAEPTPSAEASAERPPEREPDHAMRLRFGVAGFVRNTPDTGAVLAGPRVFVDVPLFDLPLLLRADLEASSGAASFGVTLAGAGGGLAISLAARASPELALRFGPRVWANATAALAADGFDPDTDVPVQVGLEVRVGLDVALAPGLELVLDAAAGTHAHGLPLRRGAERSGLVGAYWTADVGLAFH
ncbi:MAG: hypothetical protein KF729_35620 [Sandaracinaceae bacterium]|nr:hypothetical protein [Sandaracinaceae bacterium]